MRLSCFNLCYPHASAFFRASGLTGWGGSSPLRPVIKFSAAIIAILVLVATEALAIWGVMITLSRVRSGWLMGMASSLHQTRHDRQRVHRPSLNGPSCLEEISGTGFVHTTLILLSSWRIYSSHKRR